MARPKEKSVGRSLVLIMSAPGTPIPYFVLDRDGFYYTGYRQNWVSKLHFASMLSEALAEKLARRYPGSTVEREVGYDVNPRSTLKMSENRRPQPH